MVPQQVYGAALRFPETMNCFKVAIHSTNRDTDVKEAKYKRPRMIDIAREANVNRITVSRALSRPDLVADETLQRINKAIAKAGYIPDQVARGLKSERSKIVTLVTPPQMAGVYGSMLEQLALELHAGGLIVNLFPLLDAEEQREATLRELAGWRPAAIVLFGAHLNDNMRETLRNTRSPSIELLNYDENGPLACIGYDQSAAALQLSRHLLDRGYRRMAYVHSANPLSSMNIKRVTGFADGIRNSGGAFFAVGQDDEFANANGPEVRGLELKANPTFVEGFELMSRLAASDRIPDAMLFASDMVAVGALQFCLLNGLRVPRDVALCAFDGTELASVVQPGLTSLDAPFEKIAQKGAQEILRLTQDGDSEIRRICVATQIIHRDST